MVFKQTTWKHSDATVEYAKIDAGNRYVKIIDAKDAPDDKDRERYTIQVEDVETKARAWLSYWPEGDTAGARGSRGTLISLGTALAGVPIGIPCPSDIKGGVVGAEVTYKEDYPRIYKFFPAPEDIVAVYSEIDQFYEGSTDTELIPNTDPVL